MKQLAKITLLNGKGVLVVTYDFTAKYNPYIISMKAEGGKRVLNRYADYTSALLYCQDIVWRP